MSAPTPTTARPHTPRALDAFIITALIMGLRYGVLTLMARAADTTPDKALSQWDAKFYMGIAEGGYFTPTQPSIDDVPDHERTLAFFPALPNILKALHTIGLDYLTAGVLFSALISIVACLGVMTLAARCGGNTTAQRLAGITVLGAPLAITMQMPYSEALFMALAFWALVAIIDHKWLTAGALTLAAGLVRLTVVDLIAVLAIAVAINTYQGHRGWRPWAALAISPLGLISYLTWANSHLKDAGGYFGIQRDGWHSFFDFGQATLRFLYRVATEDAITGYFLSAATIILATIAIPATLPSVRRGTLDWRIWLFASAVIANMILSDGIMHSRPRLLLPATIILIPLATHIATRTTTAQRVLLAAAWVGFGAWMSSYFLTAFPWAI